MNRLVPLDTAPKSPDIYAKHDRDHMPPDDMYAEEEEDGDALQNDRTAVPRFLLFVRRFEKMPLWARCQIYTFIGAVLLFIPGILDIIFELQMAPGGMKYWSSNWSVGDIPLATWSIYLVCIWSIFWESKLAIQLGMALAVVIVDRLVGGLHSDFVRSIQQHLLALSGWPAACLSGLLTVVVLYLSIIGAATPFYRDIHALLPDGTCDAGYTRSDDGTHCYAWLPKSVGLDWRSTLVSVQIALFLTILVIAFERLVIQLIAVQFHKVAYFQRIVQAILATLNKQRLAWLRQPRRLGRTHGGGVQRSIDRGRTPESPLPLGAERDVTADDNSETTQKIKRWMSPINQMKQLVSDGLTNGFDFMSGAVLAVDDVNFATVNTAKKFAAELYEALEKSPGPSKLTSEFSETHRTAVKAFDMFDVDQNGDISHVEIEDAVVALHHERTVLQRAMRQANSAVASLHGLLTIFVIVAIIFIWVIALLSVTFSSIYVPMSTMIVAMTFIFGGTAKTVFESILFIFVVHPYDIGDKIYADSEYLIVTNIHLLTSQFRRCSDNQSVTIPNSLLFSKSIQNVRRSVDQAEIITFTLEGDGPYQDQIQSIRHHMQAFLMQNRRDFYTRSRDAVIGIDAYAKKCEVQFKFFHKVAISFLLMLTACYIDLQRLTRIPFDFT